VKLNNRDAWKKILAGDNEIIIEDKQKLKKKFDFSLSA
jgi:hypothetical protein